MKLFDFETVKDILKEYCTQNNLSFEKLKTMVKSGFEDDVYFLYHDPTKGFNGLYDETPMPLVLRMVKKKDGAYEFHRTEHTQKYLAL